MQIKKIRSILIKNLSLLARHTLRMSVVLAATVAFAADGTVPADPLVAAIDYKFVGHLQRTDDDGRVLVWEATVAGDLEGEMKWWFVDPAPVATSAYAGGKVSYYVARWELWVGERLALAGKSAGKTVFPDDADGMWDGHGIVTEASDELQALLGHRVYETGPVFVGSEPPVSFSGTGMFQIY